MTKEKSNNKNTLYCSFCGKSQHEVKKLIAGPTVFICDECVELCMDIIKEENKSNNQRLDGIPSPAEINRVLNDFVIGQDKALSCPMTKSFKTLLISAGLGIPSSLWLFDLFSSLMMSIHNSTHSSQINTVGPAINFFTSC